MGLPFSDPGTAPWAGFGGAERSPPFVYAKAGRPSSHSRRLPEASAFRRVAGLRYNGRTDRERGSGNERAHPGHRLQIRRMVDHPRARLRVRDPRPPLGRSARRDPALAVGSVRGQPPAQSRALSRLRSGARQVLADVRGSRAAAADRARLRSHGRYAPRRLSARGVSGVSLSLPHPARNLPEESERGGRDSGGAVAASPRPAPSPERETGADPGGSTALRRPRRPQDRSRPRTPGEPWR